MSLAQRQRLDLNRRAVCILGLPFDALTLDQAVERIRADAFAWRRCFVSTPNLNFAIAARTDEDFRNSVLRSDLSLVDGMPLVWIARLLGLPVPGRVAGADVFEALQRHAGPPIDVYLFGGPDGAAVRAADRINHRSGGVRCVGFEAPGFGSLESMSSDDVVGRINRSGAHFVVVALGAKKGQAWIERNATRLAAPILCHLGAVVNFEAGTIRRAPRWMRWGGLEWLWRIREEPALWHRYWSDGVRTLALIASRVGPAIVAMRTARSAGGAPHIEVRTNDAGSRIELRGDWRRGDLGEMREALEIAAARELPTTIDLSAVDAVGNSFIAILLIAKGWFDGRNGLQIVGASRTVVASMRHCLTDETLLTVKR